MTFAAGEVVTAARLNRVQPVTYFAQASANLTTGTSVADVTGCSVTFDTSAANAIYLAWGVFDMSVTTAASGNLLYGWMAVDGADQTQVAIYEMIDLGRATCAQQWRGTLASAGSHTLKLRGSRDASGAGQVVQTHTTLTVMVLEVV